MKNTSHTWSQRFFQLIGFCIFIAGFGIFYDVGKELLPLFERYVQGSFDLFETFAVLTSFWVGVPGFLWTGVRLMQLRSFSRTWLYAISFPLAAYQHALFSPERLYDMDYLLTQGVMYFALFFFVVGIVLFVYDQWYDRLSHEKAGHVRRESLHEPRVARHIFFLACVVTGLLVLHPPSIEITLDMLYSPIWHVLEALY